MNKNTQPAADLETLARKIPDPTWIAEMHEHFEENRYFRPEDLQRVFGDQTKGATMPSEESDATCEAKYFVQE